MTALPNPQIYQKPVIYIIDSDESWTRALKQCFRNFSMSVKFYTSGESFLRDSPDKNATCLVLEADLPDIDGVELLEQLRKKGFSLPVIVTSASGDVRKAVRAMKADALDFVEKPQQQKHLLRQIKGLVRGQVFPS